MASLADLYGKAKTTVRQIPANLRQSGKGLASWAVDPYGEAQRVIGEYGAMTPEQRQGLVNTAVDLFGGVDVGPVGAIKASHGSPHLFDRFDFNAMGTGGGTQAYGHGGYFAQGFDSPIAKEYQKANRDQSAGAIANKFLTAWGDKNTAQEKLAQLIERKKPDFVASHLKPYEDALQMIKSGDNTALEGALYNVELKWPDAARETVDPLGEHHLLDWHAALNEQPEYVRQAFEKADAKRGLLRNYSRILDPEDKWTRGGDAYSDLAFALNDSVTKRGSTATDNSHKVVSNYLRELGIPGIRYLDPSSRSAGKDLFNYVMFDDRFPNIVTRNGVSLTDLLRNK